MDNAWTWLKRANARAVCACCLIALVLVTAYWGWRLSRPAAVLSLVIPPSPMMVAPSGFNLLDILAQERSAFTNQQARNPFLLPESQQQSRPWAPPAATDPAGTAPEHTVGPPAAQTPAQAPKRQKINLKYQGMMRRDDGTLTALIEDSRTRHAAFYTAGTNVVGYRIERIGPEVVDIVSGAETVTVRRGVATAVEETAHAD